MAPEVIVSPAVPAENKSPATPADWEVRLAQNAASVLAAAMPEASPKRLAKELLQTLRKEHASRLRRNLDHWPEYAPQFLTRELNQRLSAEELRQEEALAFLNARHEEAVTFARAFFADQQDAEDSVGEAEIHLWEGKTVPKFFFRRLRQLIMNKLKRRKKERELFEVEDSFDGPKIRRTDDLWECVATLRGGENEAAGAVGLDDPLLDLLHREAVEEAIGEVVSDRKRHSVMQRQWWKDLIQHRPGSAELLRK